jgi:hypothetical protein
MKAAILIPVLTGKDAVGADAMAMARVLEAKGIDTRDVLRIGRKRADADLAGRRAA